MMQDFENKIIEVVIWIRSAWKSGLRSPYHILLLKVYFLTKNPD